MKIPIPTYEELEQENHELREILEHMNGTDINATGPQRGIVTELYPVQKAKWDRDRGRLKRLEKKSKRQERWLEKLSIWLRNKSV